MVYWYLYFSFRLNFLRISDTYFSGSQYVPAILTFLANQFFKRWLYLNVSFSNELRIAATCVCYTLYNFVESKFNNVFIESSIIFEYSFSSTRKSLKNSTIFKNLKGYHFTLFDIYLNMKMNSIRSEKNIATLSIVRSITNNWRRRLGIKRTSFRIRKRRKVLRTESPESPWLAPVYFWHSSIALKPKKIIDKQKTDKITSYVNMFTML